MVAAFADHDVRPHPCGITVNVHGSHQAQLLELDSRDYGLDFHVGGELWGCGSFLNLQKDECTDANRGVNGDTQLPAKLTCSTEELEVACKQSEHTAQTVAFLGSPSLTADDDVASSTCAGFQDSCETLSALTYDAHDEELLETHGEELRRLEQHIREYHSRGDRNWP